MTVNDQQEQERRMTPPGYRLNSWFVPADEDEHERAGNDEPDLPDYCRNCRAPFMAHYNGHCPR